VQITPTEGYGERDEELVQSVARQMFEGVDELEIGMQFRARRGEGVQVFTVAEIEGDQVILDGNHPLAGVMLNFDVTVVGVREATVEELSHGHAHGPDGHGH
jgi:FKBP-type peptidyl-prolyl cis-trans isomerase SlyD